MTPEYLLKRFMELGEKLRVAQKKYYANKDFLQKKKLLAEALQAEKEFDNLLFNAKQLAK